MNRITAFWQSNSNSAWSLSIIPADGWVIRPGFHYTTNATTTTQKLSDYKVEQSSFTIIALFWLEIGRCRGRNLLNGNQA